MNLTDEQWGIIAPLLPRPQCEHRGRPHSDYRDVLNGIFWVMRTGCPWRGLPANYPSRHVCSRYHREWCQIGVLGNILCRLDEDLEYPNRDQGE